MSDIPSRPFRRWAARLAFLNLIAVIGVVAWFFSAADQNWIATLMLFGPRWLAFAPLALLLPFALLTRSFWGLSWCLAAAVIIGWPFMGAVLLPSPAKAISGSPIRIMTFNADNKDCERNQFRSFIRDNNVTVIALQDADRIREPDLPDGYHLLAAANGIKLASKYPASTTGELSDARIGPARGAAKFRVAFPTGEREIGVVHLPTPRPGLEAIIARKPDGVQTLEAVISQRDEASATVKKWLGGCSLVVGDFNLPPESLIYQRDWSTYKNAFAEAGQGYGWTMFSKRGSVRIDHILFQDNWGCLGVRIGPELGSAHRPVLADFAP